MSHSTRPNMAITNALNALPNALSRTLAAQACPSFIDANTVSALLSQYDGNRESLGLALLPLAAAFAEVPISNFAVGAVAFDSAGNAYLGANMEFTHTHIGQTIHAEQSAIAHAWSRQANDLALFVINYAPCGHCRQFMNEINRAENFRIRLPECDAQSLAEFLPHAFGPADLGVASRILGQTNVVHSDDLLAHATIACENSHAPYSHSNSGIALQFSDGEIVTGQYAENAAFNPSLPPLQMALNVRRLQGKDWASISAAVLVERQGKLSQKQHSEALLTAIGSTVNLDYHVI